MRIHSSFHPWAHTSSFPDMIKKKQSAIVSSARRDICITYHWGVFVQPLLQSKSKKSYVFSLFVFVALGIQHAMCMCHIAICGLPHSIYFNTLSHKWHDFWKILIEPKTCVLRFYTTYAWNIYHFKNNCARCDQKYILVFRF